MTSSLSVEKVSHVGQTRDKTSHVGGYCVVQWRAATLEVGPNPVVNIRSNNKSWESIGEANSDVSSASVSDMGLTEDYPLMVKII